MSILRNIRNTIAEKFIPTSYLLEEKTKWEQQLIDARNGEFEDNEVAIADSVEELESINKALARRQK